MTERRILYRCDAGEIPEIGSGHLRRVLLLAQELEERHGIETAFLVRESETAKGMVQETGFRTFTLRGSEDEVRGTLRTLSEFRPGVVVLDRLRWRAGVVR